MKKIILFSATIVLTTAACKKSTPAPSTGTNTTSSNTGYYAVLTEGRLQSVYSGALSAPFNNFSAQFYSVPTTSTTTSNTVAVNSVSLNGTTMKLSGSQYADTTFSIICPPGQWAVNGVGVIPSFTYTNNNAIPSLTGYSSWPDTIYRNQNITIPMTVTGADLITVMIMDGTKGASQQMSLTASFVNFSSSQLSSLAATNNGALVVLMDKSNVQNISGKSMNFLNAYELSKTVVLK